MHAGALETARPFDVVLLVESGLELHERHDLLARFGGADQGGDDRAVAGRAVERDLDGLDVPVVGGLPDELLDRGGEALVGVVHEDIATTEDVEEVRGNPVGCREGAGVEWMQRGELQVGSVERVDRPEAGQVEWAVVAVDLLVVLELELTLEQVDHLLAHRDGDLEAHRLAEPAASYLDLDRFEQILGVFFLEVEVGVARDAERLVFVDHHAVEESMEVRRDQLFEGHQALFVLGHEEARQRLRQLQAGEALLAVLGIVDPDRQVQ